MHTKKLSVDDLSILILVCAILFGAFWRLFPAWLAGFSINDGGMFYTMIQDLQNNQYRLPAFTSYNHSNIPFVYPPLGFYLGAFLTDLFGLTTPLLIIQWLPGILNSLTILAFFFFAKEITQNKFQSAIATFVFSFTPHMTSWLSMGGGLTRSLGVIFMLIALGFIHRMFVQENRKYIWGAILFSGLTILSHTESPLYTCIIAIYIWMMKARSYKNIVNGFLVGIGALLIISPWLLWVIKTHSFEPLLTASQTGLFSSTSFFRILNIDFVTEEPYLDIFGVIGILAIAILIARKSFFLPGMLLITFLLMPRSAHTLGNIPLAIASGIFIIEIIFPSISNFQSLDNGQPKIFGFLLVLIPFILGNSLYYSITLSQHHVSEENRTAMQWVKEYTPMESLFLVITGETNGFCDSTSEWFPTLTSRKSLETLQGNEWVIEKPFSEFIKDNQNLQACHQAGLECILIKSKEQEKSFDYLYIDLSPATENCEPTNTTIQASNVLRELEEFPQFETVYISDEVIVLAHQ